MRTDLKIIICIIACASFVLGFAMAIGLTANGQACTDHHGGAYIFEGAKCK